MQVNNFFKGGFAVDNICPRKDVHVYVEGSKGYAATLNQSNVSANNNKVTSLINIIKKKADTLTHSFHLISIQSLTII